MLTQLTEMKYSLEEGWEDVLQASSFDSILVNTVYCDVHHLGTDRQTDMLQINQQMDIIPTDGLAWQTCDGQTDR